MSFIIDRRYEKVRSVLCWIKAWNLFSSDIPSSLDESFPFSARLYWILSQRSQSDSQHDGQMQIKQLVVVLE